MTIYTRTGDKGKTSLFNGSRVLKSNERVETYGTIDELNSIIGLAAAQLDKKKFFPVKKELEKIQGDLLEIGSALANPKATEIAGLEKRVKDFEKLIDELTENLPKLQNFILPGGGREGSVLHVARTVARRAERKTVGLMQKEEADENIMIYLNRLSDLLFTLARYINYKDKRKETIWKKK